MTRCYRHEEHDSLFECSFCGKPICGDCMRFVDDDEGTVICPECTSEALLETTEVDFEADRQTNIEIQKRIITIGRLRVGDVMNHYLLFLLIFALTAYWGINYYLNESSPMVKVNDWAIQNAGTPVPEMSLYLAGVLRFAEEKKGGYPDSLDLLYPDYTDKQSATVLATKDKYTFAVDRKTGFVIKCPVADRFGLQKLFVTREGIIRIE